MKTEEVTNLNNKAVAMLERQDAANALLSSADALVCCKLLSVMPEDSPSSISSTSTKEEPNEGCIDRCMMLPIATHTLPDRMANYIYKHGIPCPPETTDIGMISTIVIFNSALAHHLMAQEKGTSKRSYLHKAKLLYELAYNAADRNENTFFLFALINNLAVIERQLGNTSESNLYFDYLSSLVEQFESR